MAEEGKGEKTNDNGRCGQIRDDILLESRTSAPIASPIFFGPGILELLQQDVQAKIT